MSKEEKISNLLEELEVVLKRATEIKEEIQNSIQESTSRTNWYLHVTMPDGKQICYRNCAKTYVETIESLGTERAYHAAVFLNLRWRTYPIVDTGHDNESHWAPSGNYGIYKGGNTEQKADQLKEIIAHLKRPIEVKILDETEYQEYLKRNQQLSLT